MILIIKPKMNDLVKNFLDNKLNDLDINKATHIVFPNIIERRMVEWSKEFPQVKFFIAHKATKSKKLISSIKKNKFCMDVSSSGELKSALSAGFMSSQISCSGPKNDDYLSLALSNDCLISVDSIGELERICEVIYLKNNIPNINENKLSSKNKYQDLYRGSKNNFSSAKILLRVANPLFAGRCIQDKNTKFGILREDLDEAYNLIAKHNISFLGFHFHSDGFDSGMRAGLIEYFLSLIKDASKKGFNPSIINIGGGFKPNLFHNNNDWLDYISSIQENLKEGVNLNETWDGKNFGLSISNKGLIEGLGKASLPAMHSDFSNTLKNILNQSTSFGESVSTLLYDSGIDLMVEPGSSFFYDSGVSILPVIDVKKTLKGNLVVLDANMFTLSSRMFEPLADPMLYSKKNSQKQEVFSCFIAGNLCREDDLIMNRSVTFSKSPRRGDFLIFFNTGAYRQSYELATPQMQDLPNLLFASFDESSNEWVIGDDSYDL